MELLKHNFTYAKGLHLYRKGIQCVNDIWDNNSQDFITWERARKKFNLEPMKERDWGEITAKKSGQWRHLLKEESDVTYP